VRHQHVCGEIVFALHEWNDKSRAGHPCIAPGVIFSQYDDVAPDVVWISNARFAALLGKDGYLHGAPDLIAEVLLSGAEHERWDREVKLDLYSRRGVREYWIANWHGREVEVYRREETQLRLVDILDESDTLETPLLAGFSCLVSKLFEELEINKS
jgi:Uma2 family endonuclease